MAKEPVFVEHALETFEGGYLAREAKAKLGNTECSCLHLREGHGSVEQVHDCFNKLCPSHDRLFAQEVEAQKRRRDAEAVKLHIVKPQARHTPRDIVTAYGFAGKRIPNPPEHPQAWCDCWECEEARKPEPAITWSYRQSEASERARHLEKVKERVLKPLPWWRRLLTRLRWFWWES